MQLVNTIQDLLRSLYRLEPSFEVADFVVPRSEMTGVCKERPEQVLVKQGDDAVELALVLQDELLESTSPVDLASFCHTAEGVSHLLYLALAAERDSQISQLELELQAEIDKFALLFFTGTASAGELIQRLFQGFTLRNVVEDGPERDRYLEANRLAWGFCKSLESRFVSAKRTDPLLGELRKVYRMGGTRKLEYVSEFRL